MAWVTFAYSLSKKQSSSRVTLWRRLQRIGAIAPAGNLYVLPDLAQCVEAFQWLTQAVQEAGGQAIMARCDSFEGMSETAVINLFCAARNKEYEVMRQEIADLMAQPVGDGEALQTAVVKLRRRYADVAQIDYFDCPEGRTVAAQLTQLEQRLAGEHHSHPNVMVLDKADFQGKTWVTRPQPHVDRLSSIWLIRRFIDAMPTIRYGEPQGEAEVTFDMPQAQFGHTGNFCTFETLIATFQIEVDGLAKLAQIIHEIDLHDGLYNYPEVVGIDAVLQGWLRQGLPDEQLEAQGVALFDGLLASCQTNKE